MSLYVDDISKILNSFFTLIVFFHYYILTSCKKQVLYHHIQCIKYQLNTFFQDPGSAVNFKYPIMEKAVI